MTEERLVPLADAAFRMERPYRNTWERLLSGKLKGVKRDGRWFVYESELPEREDHEAVGA